LLFFGLVFSIAPDALARVLPWLSVIILLHTGECTPSGVARVPCALGQEIFLRPQWRGNYFRTGGKTKGCNANYGSSGNIFGQGGQDSRYQSLVSSRITVLRRNWIALCTNNKRSPKKKKSHHQI